VKFCSPLTRFKIIMVSVLSHSDQPKHRIIIHAGFAKCGSSSIQGTLFQNLKRLREDGIFLFDKNLRVAEDYASLGTPLWVLEDAKRKREPLSQRLGGEITAVAGANRQCIGVLSAENLADPKIAELFSGLDHEIEVCVVFYWRPQLQWIPSAWQQWGLKKGMPLDKFVSECIETRRPSYRLSIEKWKSVLPSAESHVRLLIAELLHGGNPAHDFFNLLGLRAERFDIPNLARNPGLDFALLHVLSKNPQLFSDVHDNRLIRSLRAALPTKFLSTNIRMLSLEQEARIEECFRGENLWLLKTFCSGIDIDEIYRAHFTPQKTGMRYSDMKEPGLIYRCLGIILESIAMNSDPATSGDRLKTESGRCQTGNEG
jgi:hypothetical protein